MAGGSINHNQIIMNVAAQLNQAHSRHKCRSFATELKLWIEEIDFFLILT